MEAMVPLATAGTEVWGECAQDFVGGSIDYSFWLFAAKSLKGGRMNVGVKSKVERGFFFKMDRKHNYLMMGLISLGERCRGEKMGIGRSGGFSREEGQRFHAKEDRAAVERGTDKVLLSQGLREMR